MSPKKPLTLTTAKRKSRISAKLAKKSEIAAKKLDKDVAKLKAKEFRESELQNSATPDIVATQSWRLATHATTQLANTEQSTEQKSNSQSTTADIDNRHSTTQTASTDPEKTLLEQQQQANAAETHGPSPGGYASLRAVAGRQAAGRLWPTPSGRGRGPGSVH